MEELSEMAAAEVEGGDHPVYWKGCPDPYCCLWEGHHGPHKTLSELEKEEGVA